MFTSSSWFSCKRKQRVTLPNWERKRLGSLRKLLLESQVSDGVIPFDNHRCNRLIEDLQSLGINVSDIKKLQDAGIHTIGGDYGILKLRKAINGSS